MRIPIHLHLFGTKVATFFYPWHFPSLLYYKLLHHQKEVVVSDIVLESCKFITTNMSFLPGCCFDTDIDLTGTCICANIFVVKVLAS